MSNKLILHYDSNGLWYTSSGKAVQYIGHFLHSPFDGLSNGIIHTFSAQSQIFKMLGNRTSVSGFLISAHDCVALAIRVWFGKWEKGRKEKILKWWWKQLQQLEYPVTVILLSTIVEGTVNRYYDIDILLDVTSACSFYSFSANTMKYAQQWKILGHILQKSTCHLQRIRIPNNMSRSFSLPPFPSP